MAENFLSELYNDKPWGYAYYTPQTTPDPDFVNFIQKANEDAAIALGAEKNNNKIVFKQTKDKLIELADESLINEEAFYSAVFKDEASAFNSAVEEGFRTQDPAYMLKQTYNGVPLYQALTYKLLNISDDPTTSNGKWEFIQILSSLRSSDITNGLAGVELSPLEQAKEIIDGYIKSVAHTMKESRLFGNDVRIDGTTTVDDNVYNTLICEILETTKLIKDPANPNGFIDKAQAYSTDWTIYNWEAELAIIKSFDTDAGTQSDDTIKVLASSQIIKDFFDIASIINDKIAGVSMTIDISIFGVPYQVVLSLESFVPGYPFSNETLRGLDWAQEIDDMNAIVDIFDAGYRPGFRADLENLIESGHNTIAVNTAASLKAKFVADGVWSYLA